MNTEENAQQIPFRLRPIEERKEKLEKLLAKNPDKIPIIFEKHLKSKLETGCGDVKFISTRNIKLGEFTKQLREIWKVKEDKSLFFSCNNKTVLNPDLLIGDLYDRSKEEDGYLYIQYREVESFGN